MTLPNPWASAYRAANGKRYIIFKTNVGNVRDFRIQSVIVIFGLFISLAMYFIMRWNAANHRADPNLDRLIGEAKH